MAYLEYGEYLSLGGVCDLTVFNRNIIRASSVIDNNTYGRLKNMSNISINVKACCRDLIEYFATNANINEKPVASWSESAGDVSESVSYGTKDFETFENDVKNIVFDYLFTETDDNGTPVLYKGAAL